MSNISIQDIKNRLGNLAKPSVLVVGDMVIDEMMYGDTERISREAPVLILQHSHTNIILGGASNAAHNISTLNFGKVGVIGLHGDDYYAPIMLEAFKKANVETKYMVKDKEGITSVKTRISGCCFHSVTQQIIRIDRQSKNKMSNDILEQVLKNIEKAVPEYDCVILSDYNIGFLTDEVIKKTIETAKKHNKPVIVDAQRELERYKGADVFTPNQPDSEKFVGFFINSDESLKKAGENMLARLGAKTVLITRGAEGMVVFEKGKPMKKIPVFNKKEVFDVTGAGDTVVASYALAYAGGFSPLESAIIGNLAASIVVKHFGCATTTINDLTETIDSVEEAVKKIS